MKKVVYIALMVSLALFTMQTYCESKQRGYIYIGGSGQKVTEVFSQAKKQANPLYCTDDGWCLVAIYPTAWKTPETFHSLVKEVKKLKPVAKGGSYGAIKDDKWVELRNKASVGFLFKFYNKNRQYVGRLMWPKSNPTRCKSIDTWNSLINVPMPPAVNNEWVDIFWDESSYPTCDGADVDYSEYLVRFENGRYFFQYYWCDPYAKFLYTDEAPPHSFSCASSSVAVGDVSNTGYVELWVK